MSGTRLETAGPQRPARAVTTGGPTFALRGRPQTPNTGPAWVLMASAAVAIWSRGVVPMDPSFWYASVDRGTAYVRPWRRRVPCTVVVSQSMHAPEAAA